MKKKKYILLFLGFAMVMSYLVDDKRITKQREDSTYTMPPTNGGERGWDYNKHKWLYGIPPDDSGSKSDYNYRDIKDSDLDLYIEQNYDEILDEYGD